MLNIAKVTAESIKSLSTKEIVELYNATLMQVNASSEAEPRTPVKKFRDRATAESRLLKIKQEWQDIADGHTSDVEEKAPAKKPAKKKIKKVKKSEVGKPKASIKNVTIVLITEGAEDKEIVDTVKEQFPDSKFDFSHVSWYRSTLFRDGIIGPEHAPRRSKAYKAWKQSEEK
jgi:hypothetical protein